MPYLETAQSWLEQSTLLLKARPTTTRITTKYTLLAPDSKKSKLRVPKPKPSTGTTAEDPTSTPAAAAPTTEPIRATLTLKTYDPKSGTTLKYTTIKAAEVARLIQILGRLARPMAGLPEVKEDVVMAESAVATADVGSGVATPVETPAAVGAKGGQGGQGGKKGKKKGKK